MSTEHVLETKFSNDEVVIFSGRKYVVEAITLTVHSSGLVENQYHIRGLGNVTDFVNEKKLQRNEGGSSLWE